MLFLCPTCVALRYTGAACELCLASFYPSGRSCIPQYISGRNIFDPVEQQQQPLTSWALAVLILSAVLAAGVLAGMAWTLWYWLVHGVPPKTQLDTALRKIRAQWEAWLVPRRVGASGKQAAVSKKSLLGDGLEMSHGLKHKGDGPVHEVSCSL